MKIEKEHYKNLKRAFVEYMKEHPNIVQEYANKNLSKDRLLWDIFHEIKIGYMLYNYLNDSHIQTALYRMFNEWKNENATNKT